MNEFWGSLTAIALAIVGVASLAVILSRNSNTAGVLSASGSSFSQALATAVSPITGVNNNASNYGQLGGSVFPVS